MTALLVLYLGYY